MSTPGVIEQLKELGAQIVMKICGKDHSVHCLLLDGMPKHEGEENTQFSYERKKHLHLNHTIVKPSFMIFVGLSFKNIICVRIHSLNEYLLSAFYVLDTVVSVCDASEKLKGQKALPS